VHFFLVSLFSSFSVSEPSFFDVDAADVTKSEYKGNSTKWFYDSG